MSGPYDVLYESRIVAGVTALVSAVAAYLAQSAVPLVGLGGAAAIYAAPRILSTRASRVEDNDDQMQ